MTGIDIAKLTAVTGIAATSAGARSHASNIGSQAGEGTGKANVPTQGVQVEVGNAIRADTPPVDNDRVTQIRQALEDGSYPIVPTEIADALIAARLMLGFEK